MEHTIAISNRVAFSEIENLLTSAFEGGSNYWYFITGKKAPKKWSYWGEYNEAKQKFLPLYVLNGGSLKIIDNEADDQSGGKKVYTLDMHAIENGLQVMASNFANHFADVMSGNTDAETGDVFLQCCLFEDVIYG